MSFDRNKWKKQMYADLERETALERARGDKDYACYRPNLSKDELKRVLDYDKKDSTQAKLPNMEGLRQEVRRFNPKASEKELKKARRDDLVAILYKAIGATPRRRAQAKRYHRFGLSFHYNGDFPAPIYRKDMSSEELKAMLELYPNPKISITELKAQLKEYGAKLSGGKQELMKRLRDEVGCKDIQGESYRTYTDVPCWEDERAALQAKFDEERTRWQKEVDSIKENAKLFKKAQNERKALHDAKTATQQKREREAASRPWCASYDPKSKSQSEFEAEWKAKYPKLSFAYSGAQMPKPADFHDVLTDYLNDQKRNAHHLLAYLEQGYGGFTMGPRYVCQHQYMTKEALKRIHGRQFNILGTSHDCAVTKLRRDVELLSSYRFKNGL